MKDKDQKEFLLKKREEFEKEDPRYGKLFEKLLEIGGEMVVPRFEPDLQKLLDRGGPRAVLGVKLYPMQHSECHRNSAILWKQSGLEGNLSFEICTGYVLDDDGLWRQHSWVAEEVEGTIYETRNFSGKEYFGIYLDNDEAQEFYNANRPPIELGVIGEFRFEEHMHNIFDRLPYLTRVFPSQMVMNPTVRKDESLYLDLVWTCIPISDYGFYSVMLKRYFGSKLVVTILGAFWLDDFPSGIEPLNQKQVGELVIHAADRIIVPTTDTVQELEEHYPDLIDKVEVIPFGCRFLEEPVEMKKFNRFTLLHVSSAALDRKMDGTKRVIDMMEHVRSSKIDLRVAVTGPRIKEIEEYIRDKNDSRIIYEGKVDNLEDLYSKSHIFVYDSGQDIFPLVLIEAQWFKLPLVVSNNIPFKCCPRALFCESDSKSLADTVKTLLGDGKLRKEMGEDGYDHVKHNLDWNQIAGKYRNMFEEVLSESHEIIEELGVEEGKEELEDLLYELKSEPDPEKREKLAKDFMDLMEEE